MSTDLKLLLDFARFGQVTRYANVAAYSVFAYDWLLCLGDEIDFVLAAGSVLAKLTYLCCRYWILLAYPVTLYIQGRDHAPSTCEKLFRVPMLIAIPSLGTVVSILTLRLYAFTGGKKYLVVLVFACFVAIAVYHTWVVFAKALLNPLGHTCEPVEAGHTNDLGGLFLGSMLLDTFITIAFVVHLVRVMKLKYTQMSTLTRAFLREGAAYFVAISAVNLLNVAFNFQPYAPMSIVNVPFSLVLPSFLACRLVINLRKLSPKARSPGSVSHDSHRRWFSPSESGPRFPLQDLAGSEGAFRIHMADERADDV